MKRVKLFHAVLAFILFAIHAVHTNEFLNNYCHAKDVHLSHTFHGLDKLTFTAFNQKYVVHLTPTSAPVFPQFRLRSADGVERRMDLFRSTRFYTATVEGFPFSTGSVTAGHEPGNIYAKLDLGTDTLILEPLEDRVTLAYMSSDVDVSTLNRGSDIYGKIPEVSFPPEPFFKRFLVKRDSPPVRKNRCELKIVADYDFYKLIGHHNYANAARYLVNLIERINMIFMPIDWGLTANGQRLVNLGFTIKEMKIFDQPTKKKMHFNADGEGYVSAMDMLESFSKEETSPACLTLLISGKVFDMSILGLANIGHAGDRGLCAPNGENTAVISVQRRSGLMITRVVDLVVAHEIGHTWGAFHDDIQNPKCVPADSPNGRYIMHESSNSGYDSNNYRFSPCSVQQIHRVLYSVVERCFVDEQKSLCGNGILEPGEECDPGGQLLQGRTEDRDPCCTSKCRLRQKAVCSPRHSECCSNNCAFLPSTRLCHPHNDATCTKASYCSGKSAKCPEPKAVADGTQCADEGKCRGGECKTLCQLISPGWTPCICEKIAESCLRCCRSPDGVCKAILPKRYLQEGAICIHGQCHNNVCVKEVTDAAAHWWNIIKDIRDNPSPKHIADYIVFIVIITSLAVWIPCAVFIECRDRANRRMRVDEDAQDLPDEVEVVRQRMRRREMQQ